MLPVPIAKPPGDGEDDVWKLRRDGLEAANLADGVCRIAQHGADGRTLYRGVVEGGSGAGMRIPLDLEAGVYVLGVTRGGRTRLTRHALMH